MGERGALLIFVFKIGSLSFSHEEEALMWLSKTVTSSLILSDFWVCQVALIMI